MKHSKIKNLLNKKINILVIFLFLILNLHFQMPVFEKNKLDLINHLEATLSGVQKIVHLEFSREQDVKKIVALIDQFNPAMTSDLKTKLAHEIYEMSLKYSNLDIALICATITHESARSWNPRVVSPAGAMGLMQIMSYTGKTLAAEEGILYDNIEDILFDPILNIRMGCRYLSSLIKAYNIDGGLAAYNGGTRIAERWIRNGRTEGILPAETAFYVPSILQMYKLYKKLDM